MVEFIPESVPLPQDTFAQFQKEQERPTRNALSFSTGQLILIALAYAGIFYAYKTGTFTSMESILWAVGITVAVYLAMQSGLFNKDDIVPTDVQIERLRKWLVTQQRVGILEQGHVNIKPQFTRQKIDKRYEKDFFYVHIVDLDNTQYPYVVTMDPYVSGPGNVGMYRADEGFFMPPPIADLMSQQTLLDRMTNKLGLQRTALMRAFRGGGR